MTNAADEISAKPTSRSAAVWAMAFQPACSTAAASTRTNDERSGVEVQAAVLMSARTG